MVFSPINRRIIGNSFPNFKLDGSNLNYVAKFKYLGHIINNRLCDDLDIEWEIKNLFIRTNELLRRFNKCSQLVKLRLFRSYCLCFMTLLCGVILAVVYVMCYYKCMKAFIGYRKYDSVTNMLVLGLPSCDTIWHNAKVVFNSCVSAVHVFFRS